MDGSLIIESYREMFEAYKRIDAACALLQQDLSPELRRLFQKQLAEAEAEFMAILDNQVDARLAELMDLARNELARVEVKQKQSRQRPHTPQLVSVK